MTGANIKQGKVRKKLLEIFYRKPYLAWYIKDVKKLSTNSLVEHILNYGDWDDYFIAENALGIKSAMEIFNDLKNKPRSNLRKKTINYFDKYFERYA